MHALYKKLLAEYFDEVIHPRMSGQTGENFLLTLVEQWNKYTMFTMLLNRLFDYVDRNMLKGINLPRLGHECQLEFKKRIVQGLEDQLMTAISDQI